MPDHAANITELLDAVASGDKDAESILITHIYQDLRRIASRYMRGEAEGHTLDTTALVHEAYLRLTGQEGTTWQNRVHFFAVAATLMRRILVDHARARNTEKRGGRVIKVSDAFETPIHLNDHPERIEALDEALTRLAEIDPRQSRIVELRYFVGLTVEETAQAMTISPRTVKREWQMAKAWLYGELSS
jgi:RNA polymerase sigma-70 factor (ECF subfamily)